MKTLKKSVAFLLIFAIVLSVAAFSVSAVPSLTTTIDVVCKGAGSVSNGTDSCTTEMSLSYTVGDEVTLIAVPDSNYEFLFWVNKETDRIMSTSKTYTFSAATYLCLEAVFDLKQVIMCKEDKTHTVIYLTEGQNILSMQTVSLGVEVPPPLEIPYMTGLTFERWDHTPEDIALSTSRIYVRPIYSETKKSYIVSTVIDGLKETQQVEYGTKVRITAPQTLHDKEFSYWVARAKDDTMEDVIVSYYAEYDFFTTVDTTLEAVYGENRGNGIATRVAGDVPNFTQSVVTIYEEHSVTEDYTVLQNGLIFTRDISIGNSYARFIINPSESKIKKGTSKYNERYGSYGVNIKNWVESKTDANGETVYYYPLLFLRSYIVVQDSDGNVTTQYSPIYVVDYTNDAFVGVIEGDNYPDPFA